MPLKTLFCFLGVALVLTAVGQDAVFDHPAAFPTRVGTYVVGDWKYTFDVTSPKTRSQGTWGRLYYKNQELSADRNTVVGTPVGKFIYLGNLSTKGWGEHGWFNTLTDYSGNTSPVFGEDGKIHVAVPPPIKEVPVAELLLQNKTSANTNLEAALLAGSSPDEEKVKFWLNNGADPNAPFKDGKTPLMDAVLRADTRHKGSSLDKNLTSKWNSVVEILLERGANPNLGEIDNGTGRPIIPNFTPLMAACAHDLTETAKIILKYKVDVNAISGGMTALAFAAREDNSTLIELLLLKGADANAGTATPLHMAAIGGNLKSVEILIANKSNVNSKNGEGYTPLELALRLYNIRVKEGDDSAKAQVERLKAVIDFLQSHKAGK